MNRAERRRAKSKKKQGIRVSNRGGQKAPKFTSWKALENQRAVSYIKKKKEE